MSSDADRLARRANQYLIDDLLKLSKGGATSGSGDASRFDNVYIKNAQSPECTHFHPPQSEINSLIYLNGGKSPAQRSAPGSGLRRTGVPRNPVPSRPKKPGQPAKATDWHMDESDDDIGVGWFYKDPMDQTLGPYTPRKMREWFDKKYFDSTLLVQLGTSDGPFAPICAIFPDLANAFNDDVPPSPRSAFQGEKSREKKLLTLVSFSEDNDDLGESWETLEQSPPK
jgi:hypothetical protein